MVTPVLALTNAEPLNWGLDPSRLRGPAVLLVPPGDANPLSGRALPDGVRVLTLLPNDDLTSVAGRIRLLARCADDDLFVWVDAMYAATLLSLEILYSDLFADRVRADRGDWPLVYGHHGCERNPVMMAMTQRELAAMAGAGDQLLAETLDPYYPAPAMEGVMPVDVIHLAQRPSVHFLRGRCEPVVHVIGDSHSLSCFTPRHACGSRNDILVNIRDITPAAVPYRWQFTHHRGPMTMYRVGRDAAELGAASLAEIEVRDGDALVFVFGEIDVRCHVMKQHQLPGRPVAEIVERLVASYIDRLAGVAARHPRSRIVVFGIIPPFDPPNYGPANAPIVGTLGERIAAARLLNAALERHGTARGFLYFDVMRELAGPDGSLPHERSDYFCHAAFEYGRVAATTMYERLAGAARPPSAPASPTTDDRQPPTEIREDIADLTLHYMGRTGLKCYVVSIGAMDGVSYDEFAGYISLYQWSGLFVEPIPEQFRRLRAHYDALPCAVGNRYENSAIAEHEGTIEMLTIDQRAIDQGRVDACFAGMSAIFPPRNGLASAGDAAVVAAYGERILVPCLTLKALLARHAVQKVDMLSIDTEGWDYRILRQLDFSRYRPKLIRCEYINLTAAEQSAIRELLIGNGYVIRVEGQNIDAVAADYWRVVVG